MAQTDTPEKSTYKATPNGASYDELGDIRNDIESLKSSVLSLSEQLQRDGKEKAGQLKDAVNDGIDAILASSDKGITAVEAQVKENPRRSIAVAFAAGFIFNLLMRRG